MVRPFKRRDCQTLRNLEIFWAVKRDDLTQEEVAARFGISQQRVSKIVQRMALFVALAPSEEYERIPQMGQLQYAHRILMEKLTARRRNLVKAFELSMQPEASYREFGANKTMAGKDEKGGYTQHSRVDTAKMRYGDWRIDRQLHEIDKLAVESRVICYGRQWKGWEELEKSGMRKKKGEGPMGNAESGMRNGAGAGAAVDPFPRPTYTMRHILVDGTEFDPQVHITPPFKQAGFPMPSEPPPIEPPPAEQPPLLPELAPESATAPPSTVPPPTKRERPPPISKLTGKRIEAPRLKSPEYLRRHGLNPDDYGGGMIDDPTPIWITGPDPHEVVLRDVSRMTAEEYSQHLRDVAFLKGNGVYIEPDHRKSIVVYDPHYYR